MNVLGFDGTLSQEEFDISHMYCTFRYEKVRDSTFPEGEFRSRADDRGMEVDDKEAPPLSDMQFAMGLKRLRNEMGQDRVNNMSKDEQSRLIRQRL